MAAIDTSLAPLAQRSDLNGNVLSLTVPQERNRVQLPTGNSPAIREVIALIRQVAEHDSTVLVLGESGTGKEVAARAIHELSPRRMRPFVAVNCGAIPAELLESELFGHERGAFTGAVSARKGRFEIAEGGTLFLDEIGDMSPTMQVKLLRVLQERVFERVGNHVSMRCNVRIIAATHRNLEDSITRGTFREDLFHRLNVFPIEMPALRARIEDLPMLVRDFVNYNASEGRGRVQMSNSALAALALHRWTGNVRELGNLIERMSIVCANRQVEIRDLPAKYRPADWSPETNTSALIHEDPLLADALNAETLRATSELQASDSRTLAAFDMHPLLARQLAAATTEALSIGSQHDNILHASNDGDSGIGFVPPAARVDTNTRALAAEVLERSLAMLPEAGLDLREHLLSIERQLIEQALKRSSGTVAHAARLLGLRRTTLVEKLRKLEMGGDVATED